MATAVHELARLGRREFSDVRHGLRGVETDESFVKSGFLASLVEDGDRARNGDDGQVGLAVVRDCDAA